MPNTVPADARNRKSQAVTWGTASVGFRAAIVARARLPQCKKQALKCHLA
jgi:hypothetical protein